MSNLESFHKEANQLLDEIWDDLRELRDIYTKLTDSDTNMMFKKTDEIDMTMQDTDYYALTLSMDIKRKINEYITLIQTDISYQTWITLLTRFANKKEE